MFRPRQHKGIVIGYEASVPGALFFFGNKNCTRELLPHVFPRFKFCFLKQVHGSDIVEARDGTSPTADGQYTSDLELALVVQTADCLPILMAGPERIVAVHAGWRGIAAQILEQASRHGKMTFAAIGPHIASESFEVGNDVAKELEIVGSSTAILPHPNPEKRKVDLSMIADLQFKKFMGSEIKISRLPIDTFTSNEFHSYRRGKEKAHRQFSFVVRLLKIAGA